MPTSHMNQPRRTLLLTGASRGIGHATVKRFSAAGWRVITCSRHPFPENCPWEAGPEDHIQVDLSDPEDTGAAIAEIKRRLDHGELHALVNNAGISPKGGGGKRLGSIDTTQETWQHVLQVNFLAPIMLARGLVDELKAAKGSVVNVTSIAGSRVHPFAGAAYATSKAALAALTREMAHDFGALGIRVNAIAPGEIDTSIVPRHRGDRRPSDPHAPAGHAGRGRQDHLRAVHGNVVLRERRRDPYQRRPARLSGASSDARRRYSHFRHLKKKYGSTAAISISRMPSG
jgi:NAD(P)-dependent dehydrogenase (short-subunit alcohol dehydrogenase family)